MPGFKANFFHFMLRNRHLFQFRLKPEVIDWNLTESVLRFRENCEKGAGRFGKMPDGIEIVQESINNINSEWIILSGVSKDKIILYTHGGGYVSGSCNDHRAIVAKFTKNTGIPALLFDYRLAPEQPFPAALEDSLAVYRKLLDDGILPSNIVIVGESAGGGLCLALLLALKDNGIPLPSAAAVAISPWTDLKCTGDSYRTNKGKCLSPEGTWTAFSKHYVRDSDPCMPWISPLYGDLRGLPPLLIYAGGDEILRDDAVIFAEKAKDAGVDVILRVGEGLFHCYPVCAPFFPEATQAMDDICGFIKNLIGKHDK